MPQTFSGGRGFELDSGSNDMHLGRPRPPRDPDELH
ncbi:KLHL21 isoform 4 [Pongo abelii]|nr:KLHL21 isoform 4 [Pongo abelii]